MFKAIFQHLIAIFYGGMIQSVTTDDNSSVQNLVTLNTLRETNRKLLKSTNKCWICKTPLWVIQTRDLSASFFQWWILFLREEEEVVICNHHSGLCRLSGHTWMPENLRVSDSKTPFELNTLYQRRLFVREKWTVEFPQIACLEMSV